MAQCNLCGRKTELYEASIPICTACVDQRERKGSGLEKPERPPKNQRRPSAESTDRANRGRPSSEEI
jgi:ribosome-binding protein aMBF1 (putative translation factor)